MQVLPKQLIAVIVKIADQIVLILNHQGLALALHLQRKHVACEVHKCDLTETIKRKYSKSWEKDYSWLYYDEDREGSFCKVCKQFGTSSRSGGVWVTKPFKNWKKAVEKLKAHVRSDSHSHATATLLAAKRAAKDGTVVQRLKNVEAQKRAQNRAALKCLILLTRFLTKEHVAHSTGKFEKLVNVTVNI